ncbi:MULTISPECIES: isochorismatase family protein [unclassified Mesorhizobium]|uniref:isochorismatase family protein n=1 Tax=unclassified Mesorhizobium TaxID=325217 RepID=UPI001FEF0F86|nr:MULTISPECIES: isochorismatase family protein [unclassified Mesorhizobium]
MPRDPVGDHLLTPQNCAVLIIDYQPIQVGSVASRDRRELVANITALARTAKLFGVPVVTTTVNVKTGINRPMIHQLSEILPAEPFDRTTINAWEDDDFRAAVEKTGRRKLVIAALWTEVCLCFPTLDALHDGYEVYPVVDAVGGTSSEAHALAVSRMVQAGAKPTSWVQLICELQRDWQRKETAEDFASILFAVEGN